MVLKYNILSCNNIMIFALRLLGGQPPRVTNGMCDPSELSKRPSLRVSILGREHL